MAKQNEPQSARGSIDRIGRALGYAAISVIGLGLVCIVIVLVSAIAGVGNVDSGIWPTVKLLPVIAFPIGILLIVIWLIITIVRRSRENTESTR